MARRDVREHTRTGKDGKRVRVRAHSRDGKDASSPAPLTTHPEAVRVAQANAAVTPVAAPLLAPTSDDGTVWGDWHHPRRGSSLFGGTSWKVGVQPDGMLAFEMDYDAELINGMEVNADITLTLREEPPETDIALGKPGVRTFWLDIEATAPPIETISAKDIEADWEPGESVDEFLARARDIADRFLEKEPLEEARLDHWL